MSRSDVVDGQLAGVRGDSGRGRGGEALQGDDSRLAGRRGVGGLAPADEGLPGEELVGLGNPGVAAIAIDDLPVGHRRSGGDLATGSTAVDAVATPGDHRNGQCDEGRDGGADISLAGGAGGGAEAPQRQRMPRRAPEHPGGVRVEQPRPGAVGGGRPVGGALRRVGERDHRLVVGGVAPRGSDYASWSYYKARNWLPPWFAALLSGHLARGRCEGWVAEDSLTMRSERTWTLHAGTLRRTGLTRARCGRSPVPAVSAATRQHPARGHGWPVSAEAAAPGRSSHRSLMPPRNDPGPTRPGR